MLRHLFFVSFFIHHFLRIHSIWLRCEKRFRKNIFSFFKLWKKEKFAFSNDFFFYHICYMNELSRMIPQIKLY